jgi:hypothetical protein
MNDQLDLAIRVVLNELVADTPTLGPVPSNGTPVSVDDLQATARQREISVAAGRPTAFGSQRPHGRRLVAAAAVAALIAVGVVVGVIALRARSSEIVPGSGRDDSPTPTCDDYGCHGFDDLAVVAGASDYYTGPASLGSPHTNMANYTSVVRCATFNADGRACATLQGMNGVALVWYGTDHSGPSVESSRIEIYTTFTNANASDYANAWSFSTRAPSAVVVRGQPAVHYTDGYGSDAVSWQERPGVIVTVSVPPAMDDQLLAIADSVQRLNGPTTIPSRVIVPTNSFRSQHVGNNDPAGLVVGRLHGIECISAGIDPTGCGQDISDLTFAFGPGTNTDLTSTSTEIMGAVPTAVATVRITTKNQGTITATPASFSGYTHRFYDVTITASFVLAVDWLDATGATIATTSHVPQLAGPDTHIRVADASGDPEAGQHLAAKMTAGYTASGIPADTSDAAEHALIDHVAPRTTVYYLPGFDRQAVRAEGDSLAKIANKATMLA